MKLTLTVELDVEARDFPQPLPLPELVAEFQMKQMSLDSLLHSKSLTPVLRCLLAEHIIADGGVQIAQAIANREHQRDGHILNTALSQHNDTLAAWVIERYVRRGSTDDLIKSVTSRLRFGAVEITDAHLDTHVREEDRSCEDFADQRSAQAQ